MDRGQQSVCAEINGVHQQLLELSCIIVLYSCSGLALCTKIGSAAVLKEELCYCKRQLKITLTRL